MASILREVAIEAPAERCLTALRAVGVLPDELGGGWPS